MDFSEEEVQQLIKAWAAVSLAFAIVFARQFPWFGILATFVLSGLTVGISFILHELAHKFWAQRCGCWAEFRAFDAGLILAVLMAFVGGLVFAAPGAVVISGSTNEEQNGHIAVVGPLTNLILAILFGLGMRILRPSFFLSYGAGLSAWLALFFSYGKSINSWLAFFNLLPFGVMDGLKVKQWNMGVWLILVSVAAGLVFL